MVVLKLRIGEILLAEFHTPAPTSALVSRKVLSQVTLYDPHPALWPEIETTRVSIMKDVVGGSHSIENQPPPRRRQRYWMPIVPSAPSSPILLRRELRARFTRLLIVPIGQSQRDAASS